MKVIRQVFSRLMCLLIIIILFGLSGCARYKAMNLNKLAFSLSDNKQPGFGFAYYVLNKDDCKRYLDRNIIAKGYQPIHITFINNTNHHLNFSLDSFSFPCAATEEVAIEVHTNTTGRAVGYGVAGIFIWPLIIPAIVDGVGSAKANDKLDSDFSRKGLRSQIIAPSSTINGLIFVPVESFNPDFTLTVTDITNKQQYVLSPSNPVIEITGD